MEDVTKSSERKANEVAERAKEGIDKAKNKSVDMMEKSFPVADEAIERAKAKGEAIWQRARSKSQDLVDEVQSSSQEAWRQTRSYIQKKPGRAIGYAALAGLVLGFLIAPKSRGQ